MVQITDLPESSVRKIFRYLRLIDVVRIDVVFSEWNSIKQDYLKDRHHLTLLLGKLVYGSSNFKLPMESQLAVEEESQSESSQPYMTIQLCGDEIEQLESLKLSELLPSLESLDLAVVNLNVSIFERSLFPLIESFAARLITFKFRYFSRCEKIVLSTMLECINMQMVKLECLHLDFFDSMRYNSIKVDLQILQQLKEFRFYSLDRASILYESLHRYATDRLRTIEICHPDNYENLLTEFGSMPLAKSFKILLKLEMPTDFALCASFFTAFDSLRNVNISLGSNTLAQLTRCLSPLRDLVYLELEFECDMSQFDSIPDEQIHPLPVRAVKLYAQCDSHDYLHSRHWPRIFAACRVLSISIWECECDLDYDSDLDGFDEILQRFSYDRCRDLLMAPFEALPDSCTFYPNLIYPEDFLNIMNSKDE